MSSLVVVVAMKTTEAECGVERCEMAVPFPPARSVPIPFLCPPPGLQASSSSPPGGNRSPGLGELGLPLPL